MSSMRIWPLAVAAACFSLAATMPSSAGNPIPEEAKTNGFFVGCQAWTWNHFTVFEAIEKTAAAGGKVIEFFPGQTLSKEEPNVKWDHNAPSDIIDKVKAKLSEHHIKAV